MFAHAEEGAQAVPSSAADITAGTSQDHGWPVAEQPHDVLAGIAETATATWPPCDCRRQPNSGTPVLGRRRAFRSSGAAPGANSLERRALRILSVQMKNAQVWQRPQVGWAQNDDRTQQLPPSS